MISEVPPITTAPFSTSQWLLLADYDNLRVVKERNINDVEMNLESILSRAISTLRPYLQPRCCCELRLYGGWSDEAGRYTPRALRLLTVLHRYRRRVQGHSILPVLTETGFSMSDSRLVGSLRSASRKPRQKMVDTLLTVDLLLPRTEPGTCLAVLSSDDDFVPGLLASRQSHHHPVVLVRRASAYPRPNDRLLIANKVLIAEWEDTSNARND